MLFGLTTKDGENCVKLTWLKSTTVKPNSMDIKELRRKYGDGNLIVQYDKTGETWRLTTDNQWKRFGI